MHTEWFNQEPTFWNNFSVGHLWADTHRPGWWWMFGSFGSRGDFGHHVSLSTDGGETWSVMADQREDPANDEYNFGTYSWFVNQNRDLLAAVGGSAVVRMVPTSPPNPSSLSRLFLVYAQYGTDLPDPNLYNIPQDFIGDAVPDAEIPGSEFAPGLGPGVVYTACPAPNTQLEWYLGGQGKASIDTPMAAGDGSYFTSGILGLSSRVLADERGSLVYSVEGIGGHLELYEENMIHGYSGPEPSHPSWDPNSPLQLLHIQAEVGRRSHVEYHRVRRSKSVRLGEFSVHQLGARRTLAQGSGLAFTPSRTGCPRWIWHRLTTPVV